MKNKIEFFLLLFFYNISRLIGNTHFPIEKSQEGAYGVKGFELTYLSISIMLFHNYH